MSFFALLLVISVKNRRNQQTNADNAKRIKNVCLWIKV